MSSWKAISALLLLAAQGAPYEGTVNPVTALARLDVTCVLRTWRIKGALWCGPANSWKPCLWVENAYPCGLFEVVRQPWKSHVIPLPGGRRTTGGHKEAELQYGEARVFTYIPPLGQQSDLPIAAPRGPAFMVNYLSELDGKGWRTGLLERFLALACDPVGAWGCGFPRTGFVQQPSEPLAAHLQAIRAAKVAALPFGRVILSPYSYEPRLGHYVQMISPVVRACTTIGNGNLPMLEAGTGSRWGAYLFVHWGIFDGCKNCLPPRLMPPRIP